MGAGPVPWGEAPWPWVANLVGEAIRPLATLVEGYLLVNGARQAPSTSWYLLVPPGVQRVTSWCTAGYLLVYLLVYLTVVLLV